MKSEKLTISKAAILLAMAVVLAAAVFAVFSCDDGKGTHTHAYSTTWSKDATNHWHECTANDGAKTDTAPHTAGDWIIDSQATYDTDGSRHKKCTVCEYTTDIETIAKFKTERPFTIGSVDFIFEYRKDDTTSWEKLESAVNSYNNNIDVNPDGEPATLAQELADRTGANYKIIVDYSNEGKAAEFTATNGQTLTVGADYLATQTINRTSLTDAFRDKLLAKPWPII